MDLAAPPPTPADGSKLFVCDGCLKYMPRESDYVSHRVSGLSHFYTCPVRPFGAAVAIGCRIGEKMR